MGLAKSIDIRAPDFSQCEASPKRPLHPIPVATSGELGQEAEGCVTAR
jgi:hypothetical protein